jgi:hypothetical protein
MSLAPIAQRLSSASFPPQKNLNSKGGLGACSTFRYLVTDDARVVSHYIAVFFALLHLFSVRQPNEHLLFNFIQQALYKVAQSTLQELEHTTKKSLLNQRHGSSLADKWYLWLFAASKTIHRGVRGNLIRVR